MSFESKDILLLDAIEHVLHRKISNHESALICFNINKLLHVISEYHERTGIEIDVNSVYMTPDLDDFADASRRNDPLPLPKIIKIRDGDPSCPVFFFAGGASCLLELKDMIEGFLHQGALYGIRLSDFELPAANPARVADEVDTCIAALAEGAFKPPFRLIGYSFGGVFALELARALTQRGQAIEFVAMVDTPTSEHAWPLPVWLRYTAGRLAHRLKRSSAHAAQRGGGQSQLRRSLTARLRKPLNRLLFRFRSPLAEHYPIMAPQWVGNYPPAYDRAARQLLRMKGLYRPTPYPGTVYFFRATGGSPIDCDPRSIWHRFLPAAQWFDMQGTHQSVVVGRHGHHLGAVIAELMTRRQLVAS